MSNRCSSNELLEEFDPFFTTASYNTGGNKADKRQRETILDPSVPKTRPTTPVICTSSRNSEFSREFQITNDRGEINPTANAFFFISKFSKSRSTEDEFIKEKHRSLALVDVPLDGSYFVKISVKIVCLPQQPYINIVEGIHATISDIVCALLQIVDTTYESGVLSTTVGYELHCAKTNECLSGNGKLCEYRVFTNSLRFTTDPVYLFLTVAKTKLPRENIIFSKVDELMCQKNLEKCLLNLDSQLKILMDSWQSGNCNRNLFLKVSSKLWELERSLNLQHTAGVRKLAATFQKLSSSVIQSYNLPELIKRTAKYVSDFINSYASSFNVPMNVKLNLSGAASTYFHPNTIYGGTVNRGRLSVSLSSLHRYILDDKFQLTPPYVECAICDSTGNDMSDFGRVSFTFEHKLKCTHPNMLTLFCGDDTIPLPLGILEKLSPPAFLTVRVYILFHSAETLSRSLPIMERNLHNLSSIGQRGTLIAWANYNLFDDEGCLKSGIQVIPLWPAEFFNPQLNEALCPCVNMNDTECMLLIGSFHVDHPLYAQSSMAINPYLEKSQKLSMPPSVEERFYRLLYSDFSSLAEDDQSFFWSSKEYLRSEPKALPLIIWSAPKKSLHAYNELAKFIENWPEFPGDLLSVLRLLLPELANPIVTEVLSAILLRKICADSIIDFCLPQFIQSLRLHGWTLANAVAKRCSENHELSVTLYWLLAFEANNSIFVCCRSFYKALSLCLRSQMRGTPFIEEITQQHFAVANVLSMAEEIYNIKNSGKSVNLQQRLTNLMEIQRQELPKTFTFPCIGGSDTRLSGLDSSKCAVLASRAAPLRLKFKPSEEVNVLSDSPLMCIVKVGDDLRSDMVALQLVRIMDYIWMSCNLDLRVVTFKVLPTDKNQGIIEFVPGADQLRVAQGGLSKYSLIDWFTSSKSDKTPDPAIIDTFSRTCAAWCVASYIIGVGDRHNDNILLKKSAGHLFHIDFGRLFGDAERIAGVSRDRVPFVFTDSMAMLISGGKELGQDFAQAGYQQFVDTCCLAFNLIRRRGEAMLLSAVKALRFPPKSIKYLKECLMLSLSDYEASCAFKKLIEESLKSVAPQFNFFIHNIAQSFVKQPPSLQSECQKDVFRRSLDMLELPMESLVLVEVTAYHKVRYPVKHYLFQISVYLENVTNLSSTAGGAPLLIFRRYSECYEFRQSLAAEFPGLASRLPAFKHRGDTENRDYARKRMVEINNFLKYLFTLSLEVRGSNSVAKFFTVRPLDLKSASVHSASSGSNDGQLWMTVAIREPDSPILEVLVRHGVNLFYDDYSTTGRVKVTLSVTADSVSQNQNKYRTDLAPPGSQPLFNKLFQWRLPKVEHWPSNFFVKVVVKIHPANLGLSVLSSSSQTVRIAGAALIDLTKMVTWAKSWPVVDSQYFKLAPCLD